MRVCEKGCHRLDGGTHVYERDACACSTGKCGKCTLECYPEALELAGRTVTVEEVIAEVVKDELFYQTSGGGMTVSGGEPMMQFEFTRELLSAAKEVAGPPGLHTCVETSGFSTFARFAEILPYVDLFLYDVKETDPELHEESTGVPNRTIIENVLALDRAGAGLILRYPIIPGLNDREAHFEGIADLADRMDHVREIHILPYHALGTSKSRRLGKTPPLSDTQMPEEAQVQHWVAAVQELTRVPVRKD